MLSIHTWSGRSLVLATSFWEVRHYLAFRTERCALIVACTSEGWSLGGCVALEVASRLMQLSQYTVNGVIMIDSVFPTPTVTNYYPRTIADVAASFQLPSQMSETRRTQALHCILHAHEMQRDWRPPRFASGPPPTVLMRAVDPVYLNSEKSPHYLDLVRGSSYLGWEEYDPAFIQTCLEIPGNHFTLFDDAHVCFPRHLSRSR